jgi:hypothetical protein
MVFDKERRKNMVVCIPGGVNVPGGDLIYGPTP